MAHLYRGDGRHHSGFATSNESQRLSWYSVQMDAQTDFQLSQVSEFNNPVDKAILIRDSADPAEALNSTGIAQTEVVEFREAMNKVYMDKACGVLLLIRA